MSACAHVTGSPRTHGNSFVSAGNGRPLVTGEHPRKHSCSHILGCTGVNALTAHDLEHVLVAGNLINLVSVSTVLLTSSEQAPLKRHNHRQLAEHCATRNFHEPLALLTASSVLAAFIMAVLPLNVCGVCKTPGICMVFMQFVVHLNDGSCISCFGAKR